MSNALLIWLLMAIALSRFGPADYRAFSLHTVIATATVLFIVYAKALTFALRPTSAVRRDGEWGLQPVYLESPSNCCNSGLSIVFVHGLDSNPAKTWKSRAHQFDWIKESLIPEVRARLDSTSESRLCAYQFNYESRWRYAASAGRRRLYGERLQFELRKLLAQPNERVILVGHSFGGLVIKEALTLPQEESFFVPSRIAGIMFLGTPHQGSGFALLGFCTALLLLPLRPDLSALVSLRSNSATLKDLHDNFITTYGDIPMRNFRESDPISLTIWGIEIFRAYVVSETSATFSHKGTRNIMLKANHSNLNKYDCNSDNYCQFRDQLFELLEKSSTFCASKQMKQNQHPTVPTPYAEGEKIPMTTTSIISTKNLSIFGDPDAKAYTRRTFQKAIDMRHASTCLWIESSGSDFHWLRNQKQSSLLWLTGNIGCGKTTICAYFVQHLTQMPLPSAVILYAFCSATNLSNVPRILGVIIDQLLEAVPRLWALTLPAIHEVAKSFDQGKDKQEPYSTTTKTDRSPLLDVRHQGTWPLKNSEFLWNVLQLLIRSAENYDIYLVMDGLDALDTSVLDELMPNLRKHILDSEAQNVKMILSNRSKVEQIRCQISKLEKRSYRHLELDGLSHVRDDVQEYLTQELSRIRDLRGWSKSRTRTLLKKVSAACNNIFLYAGFIVQNLEMCPTYSIDKMIGETPGDLEELYEQALKGIAQPVRARQSNVFLCLLYSYEDLTLTDLLATISTPRMKKTEDAKQELLHDIMLHGPLLHFDRESEVVGFVHPTAKDYILQRANSKDRCYKPFLQDRRCGHETLAGGCLSYIISQVGDEFPVTWGDGYYTEIAKLHERLPGIKYAFSYWLTHYRAALSGNPNPSEAERLLKLLRELDRLRRSGAGRQSFWSHFLLQSMRYKTVDEDAQPKFQRYSTVEFFSLLGIPEAVEFALRKDKATESQALVFASQEKALNLAVYSSYPETINVLLNHFKLQSLDGPAYRNAIPMAVRTGGPELVSRLMLLRPSRSLSELASAIFNGSRHGNVSALRIIFSEIDFINAVDRNKMTVLHWLFWQHFTTVTTIFESLAVVEAAGLILSEGADINAQDCLGNTILHYVCYSSGMGRGIVLQRLVNNGARIDIPNKFGWLPIHLLAYRGVDMSGIGYLDKLNPDLLYFTTRGGSTVLHWAVQRPESRFSNGLVLKYLLCRGLLLNSTNRDGVCPLDILSKNSGLRAQLWNECEVPRCIWTQLLERRRFETSRETRCDYGPKKSRLQDQLKSQPAIREASGDGDEDSDNELFDYNDDLWDDGILVVMERGRILLRSQLRELHITQGHWCSNHGFNSISRELIDCQDMQP